MSEELTEEQRKAQRRANMLEAWDKSFGVIRSQYGRHLMLSLDDPDTEEIRALDQSWRDVEDAGGPEVLQKILCIRGAWTEGRRHERIKTPIPVPQAWANGDPVDPVTQLKFLLLRQAGCKDPLPLLGQKQIRGRWIPRCRLCNTVARLEPGTWPDVHLLDYLRDAELVQEYGAPARVDPSQPT